MTKFLTIILILFSFSMYAEGQNGTLAALDTIKAKNLTFENLRKLMLDFSEKDNGDVLKKEYEIINPLPSDYTPGKPAETVRLSVIYIVEVGPGNEFGLAIRENFIDGLNVKEAYLVTLNEADSRNKAALIADIRYKINYQTRYYIQDEKIYIMIVDAWNIFCVDLFKLLKGRFYQ